MTGSDDSVLASSRFALVISALLMLSCGSGTDQHDGSVDSVVGTGGAPGAGGATGGGGNVGTGGGAGAGGAAGGSGTGGKLGSGGIAGAGGAAGIPGSGGKLGSGGAAGNPGSGGKAGSGGIAGSGGAGSGGIPGSGGKLGSGGVTGSGGGLGSGGSGSGGSPCGACPANSTCNGTTCLCNSGYQPDPTFTKCLLMGGSCAGTGVDSFGYCVDSATWVWCDPLHGLTYMNCPQAVGTNCYKAASTGTWGACGCGTIDSLNGVCGNYGSSENELHYFCSTAGILYVNNCKSDSKSSAGFCGTYVTSFGWQTTCFCSACTYYDYSRNMCSAVSGTCSASGNTCTCS